MENITFILLTNRNENLLNFLSFFGENFFSKDNLFIFDASENENSALYSLATYFYLPETHYYDRLLKSVDYVKTKYVKIMTDDDLFSEVSITTCVKFLEEHDDYSCVKCNNYIFSYEDGLIRYRPVSIHSWNRDYSDVDINVRMRDFYNSYNTPYYSVMRAGIYSKIFSERYFDILRKAERLYLNEDFVSFCLLVEGKFKNIDAQEPWIGPCTKGAPYIYQFYGNIKTLDGYGTEAKIFERSCRIYVEDHAISSDIRNLSVHLPTIFCAMVNWHSFRNELLRESFGTLYSVVEDSVHFCFEGEIKLGVTNLTDNGYFYLRRIDLFLRESRHYLPSFDDIVKRVRVNAQNGSEKNVFNLLHELNYFFKKNDEMLFIQALFHYRYKKYKLALMYGEMYNGKKSHQSCDLILASCYKAMGEEEKLQKLMRERDADFEELFLSLK